MFARLEFPSTYTMLRDSLRREGLGRGISGCSYGKAEVNDIPHLHNIIFSREGKNEGQRGHCLTQKLCRQGVGPLPS